MPFSIGRFLLYIKSAFSTKQQTIYKFFFAVNWKGLVNFTKIIVYTKAHLPIPIL